VWQQTVLGFEKRFNYLSEKGHCLWLVLMSDSYQVVTVSEGVVFGGAHAGAN
jgi:hypothetical protein